MKTRAFHFCAEFNSAPGVIHLLDGVVTSDVSPFTHNFYAGIKSRIAAAMTPPREPATVALKSLSLLGERDA